MKMRIDGESDLQLGMHQKP